MKIKQISVLTLAVIAGSLLFSGTSFARDRDDDRRVHGHGHERHRYYERSHDRHERDYRHYKIKMDSRSYRDLQRNMSTAYWNKCSVSPRGRYYECSPSRYSRVNYVIGKPIPRHATVWQVPHQVRYSLPRPYTNTQYVWVGRDILLIDQRDNTILDIIHAVLN